MGCVYLVRNLINDKKYIGKTIYKLEERKRGHKYETNRKSNKPFHNALRKYVFDVFEWEILFESDSEEILLRVEKIEILEYKTKTPNGYNLTDGGDGVSGATWKLSEETKRKIGDANRGKVRTEEMKKRWSESHKGKTLPYSTVKKIANANRGKNRTEEFKQRMRMIHTGRIISKETRDKISTSLIKYFSENGVSQNIRSKISMSSKGKIRGPLSDETKNKISKANKGRKHTEEEKLKISLKMKGRRVSLGMTGKKHSDETKKKMKASALIREAKRRKVIENATNI